MSGCECYKIGGPWISFDPDCAEHGYAAQTREEERYKEAEARDQLEASQAARIEALENQVRDLTQRLDSVAPQATQIQEVKPAKAPRRRRTP